MLSSQAAIPKAKWLLSTRNMLSTSILFVLCCVGIGATLSPSSSSAETCSNWHDLSVDCSFHQTCIESIYQCGPMGLALGYAEPRCERLSALQISDSGCQECIRSPAILQWALLSEKCFQSNLLLLAGEQPPKPFPDPPDCLHFEKDALDILRSCYLETDTICQLMNKDTINLLETDLTVVLDAILVNSYYKSSVTMHMRDVVLSCSFIQSSILADKIAPETERMSLCVSFYDQSGLIEEGLTEALGEKLNQSSNDFLIAGYDTQLVYNCRKKSEPAWSVSSADYFVVGWTVTEGADKSALTDCQFAGRCIVDNAKSLVFFEYTSLTTSSCGDGRREATESCDAFVYTGMDGHGCSEQCDAAVGYECTTEQLQQSLCWKTLCGDGVRTSDEECDVGNASLAGCNPANLAGCNPCSIQEGYQCQTPYNATSTCSKSRSRRSTSLGRSSEVKGSKNTDDDSRGSLPSRNVIVGVGTVAMAAFVACVLLATCVFYHRRKKVPCSGAESDQVDRS